MITAIDLTGQRFGKLVVLKRGEKLRASAGGAWWLCQCDCGRLKSIPGGGLRSGKIKSCGQCGYKEERSREYNLVRMEGQRFGHLIVLELAENQPGRTALWKCKCDCGAICYGTRENLLRGDRKTCGRPECPFRTKWANDDERRAANIFHNMKQRCYNPNDMNFPRWGAKGIDICPEWLADNKAFVKWSMENGYKPGLSIDRIDNSKGYSPDNCRWVPMVVQDNNRSNNRVIEYEGLAMTVAEWARNLDVPVHQLYKMSDEEILSYIVARS